MKGKCKRLVLGGVTTYIYIYYVCVYIDTDMHPYALSRKQLYPYVPWKGSDADGDVLGLILTWRVPKPSTLNSVV